MSRRLALALVVAASLLAHLKGISSPLLDYHYHRQCNTADIARNYSRHGLRFATPQVDWEGGHEGRAATEFPLYMWLMGLLWPLFGLAELWGRLLSCAFSAATAVYLFLFLERRLGRAAAFWGAAAFCFIPLEVYFGRTVQPEALALLSTMAALYHWDSWLDAPQRKGQWALATAFAFLAIAHKLPYAYILLPLAGLAWLAPRRRSFADPWCWASCVLSAGAVFGWYKYASAGVYVVPAHEGEFLKMLEYAHLPYFTFFLFFSRLPELATTYAGLALGLAGAWALRRQRKLAFFALWWGAVAFDQIAGGGYAHWHDYTALPWAPVNAAFIGAGVAALKDKLPRPALAVLLLCVPLHAALRVGHWYKVEYPYMWGAREAAAAVSSPDDLFACNERTSSAFLFYLDRKGWAWEATEAGAAQSRALLESKIKDGAKFYATSRSRLSAPGLESYRDHLFAAYRPVYDKDDLLIFRLTPP